MAFFAKKPAATTAAPPPSSETQSGHTGVQTKTPAKPAREAAADAKPPQRPGPVRDRITDERAMRFQELKASIHRKLVEQIDMTKLAREVSEELRSKWKQMVKALCEGEHAPELQRARTAGSGNPGRDVRPRAAGITAGRPARERHSDQRSQAGLRRATGGWS